MHHGFRDGKFWTFQKIQPKKETFSFGLRYVGYSQDSMTAAEFDITDVLKQSKPSENGGFLPIFLCFLAQCYHVSITFSRWFCLRGLAFRTSSFRSRCLAEFGTWKLMFGRPSFPLGLRIFILLLWLILYDFVRAQWMPGCPIFNISSLLCHGWRRVVPGRVVGCYGLLWDTIRSKSCNLWHSMAFHWKCQYCTARKSYKPFLKMFETAILSILEAVHTWWTHFSLFHVPNLFATHQHVACC